MTARRIDSLDDVIVHLPNGAPIPPPEEPEPARQEKRRRRGDFQGFQTSAQFIEQMQPPDYLMHGLLARGASYTLTGRTGHCKTLIALAMALAVAKGDWFCGHRCKQGTVAFFAGENPENVQMQFYSMCWDRGIDAKTLPIIWHSGVFNLDQARAKAARKALAAFPDLALCIWDSLQAFFTGDNDSDNMQMLDTAIDFREMAVGHPTRPVNLILAHPVKNAGPESLYPRGGSALTNELDGNLTVWSDEDKGIVSLHWLGKFRGSPFDMIKLEAVRVKPEKLEDAEGNQMACTVVRPLGDSRAAEIARVDNTHETRILRAFKDDPTLSQEAIGLLLNVSRSTARRKIETLTKTKKWLREYPGHHVLTKEGEKALTCGTGNPEKGGQSGGQ